MAAGIWFWLIYVLCLVFGTYFTWPGDVNNRRPFGHHIVIFILLGLLGWGVFGSPIR